MLTAAVNQTLDLKVSFPDLSRPKFMVVVECACVCVSDRGC